MEERRRYIRIPDASQISYKVIPPEFQGEYLTKDISQGGIRFLVRQFIPKNKLLKIRLTLNKVSVAFEGIVKIMWIKELPNSSNYEVGVQFVDIPQKASVYLLDYIKAFLAQK